MNRLIRIAMTGVRFISRGLALAIGLAIIAESVFWALGYRPSFDFAGRAIGFDGAYGVAANIAVLAILIIVEAALLSVSSLLSRRLAPSR